MPLGRTSLAQTAATQTAPGQAVAARRLLVFGDSLSAGYGMAREAAWPSLLAKQLAARKQAWQVINASVSGETTHGGLARLKPTLEKMQPAAVILELGGNDALRGTPIEDTRRNLDAMAKMIVASGARLLVVGVGLPPNFGDDYTSAFAALFTTLAHRYKAALVPNLLAALGTSREEFQADGIHPLPAVQDKLLATVQLQLEPLLRG